MADITTKNLLELPVIPAYNPNTLSYTVLPTSGSTGTDYAMPVGMVANAAVNIANTYTDMQIAGITGGYGYFLQAGTGAVARTFQSKMRDVVSITDFGAVSGGTVDCTVAIQKAVNSGAVGVYIPTGTYLCGPIVMPQTRYFTLFGDGQSSVLVQKAGGSLLSWPVTTSDNYYVQGLIKGLNFDGTLGTASIIDTSYTGGNTFEDIYISNLPVGHDGIYINGMASVYTHDMRIKGLQVYTSTAGRSGLAFGPTASDSDVTDFIMNGNFVAQYCLYLSAGATTITLANSHPYNATINVMEMAGQNSQCSFTSVTFDNAQQDIIFINNGSNNVFVNCYFEAIPSGYRGVSLASCSVTQLINCRYGGSVGANAGVGEDSGCNDTQIIGGTLGTVSNYVQPFLFFGAHSYATGIPGYNPLRMRYGFSGTTQTAQVQNSTMYLGVNGANANSTNTAYVVPEDSLISKVYIACESTPSSGQNFTFTVKDSTTTLGTLTLTNGQFGGTIAINQAVPAFSQLYITSVFSATSGSSNVRYAAYLTA